MLFNRPGFARFRAKSMAGNDFEPNFEDGKAAYDRGDFKTALARLRASAEAGDARSQYLLGWMYTGGVLLAFKLSSRALASHKVRRSELALSMAE